MTFRDASFYALYRIVFYPLARALFSGLSLTNTKIRRGLEMRRGRPWLKGVESIQQPTFWFHCASGEFEYAKPVITRFKKRNPQCRICVTYFSPTFAKAVAAFPGVDLAVPLPWDTASELQNFIRVQKPAHLLIARTDTWPELVRQARKARIPTLLFAATLSSQSARVRQPFVRWMTQAVFQNLDAIFCVGAEDLESFKQIGFGDRAVIAGDTRYDQVIARLENPKPIRDELFLNSEPDRVLVCGSTWPEDETVLLDTAQKVRDWNFVLVPHEPTDAHIKDLEAQCTRRGLKSVRYTEATHWPHGSILLVDKIGILAELYQKGAAAFVGGSFKKTVHSVMEPLASGALTIVGPLHRNNREAIEFAKLKEGSLSLVTEVRDADQFAQVLKTANNLGAVSEKIRREIKSRAGKSELVISHVCSEATTGNLY